MRFLILCLFFGIICATNKEKPVEKNYEQLIEIVEDLKSQVDDLKKNQNRDGRINNLKNELDYPDYCRAPLKERCAPSGALKSGSASASGAL